MLQTWVAAPRGRHAGRLTHAPEVVIHEVYGHGCGVVPHKLVRCPRSREPTSHITINLLPASTTRSLRPLTNTTSSCASVSAAQIRLGRSLLVACRLSPVVARRLSLVGCRFAAQRQKPTFMPMSTLRGFWTPVAVRKNGDVITPLKPDRFAWFVRLLTLA